MLKSRLKFKNCRIDSAYVSTRAKLEDHIVIAEDSVIEPTVKIGRYTYMQANCNLNNCIMGSFCSLGNNVLIGPWQHPLNLMSTSPKIYRDILGGDFSDKPLQTTIGNDVWIGSNVIIIGGITIGNGAVIGAGSVVTKDVPDYAVVVGNPSRILRYRFSATDREKIDRLNWWNWNNDEIVKNKKIFEKEFLNIKS